MRQFIKAVAAAFVVFILLAQARVADAAEIKILCAVAMQQLMEDIGPKFEQATGHKVVATFATLGPSLKRMQDGESYDVAWIARAGVETLIKDGKAVASTVTAIAVTQIGVAVRKGAPKPDISSPEAFKRALLTAKTITHANPKYGGLSGLHVAKVLDRLGIAEEMKSKTVLLDKAGLAAVLVANGEAEIVVQPIQELVVVPGLELVGPLPRELQDTLTFQAVITVSARDVEAAKVLINFLRTPETIEKIKAMGMQPG
jgi:molybdate transport system substrate-binding protein